VAFERIDERAFIELESAIPPEEGMGKHQPPAIAVLSPGSSTRLEGSPRFGFGRWGVPPGGAMDLSALAQANAAVGNPLGATGLEIALGRAAFELLANCRCSLQGALADAFLDGRSIRWGETFFAKAGQRLELGRVSAGARVYLCVEGGLESALPGSAANVLRKGDIVHFGVPEKRSLRVPPTRIWNSVLRVTMGPQSEHFSAGAKNTLLGANFRVSALSDRRGVRLDGPSLEMAKPSDIPPEGTAPGAIQVPGNGLPIILGPDRPVTGGYAKIATVIGADLSFLGQLRPGASLRFEEVSIDFAKRARGDPG
jgi:biotin-dependent carboxylase-like uncharacterized protein